MRILSKYKDYYDYLSGIYGVDDKIVLDRRKFDHITTASIPHGIVRMYICDHVIEGYYLKHRFYWGDDLKLISTEGGDREFDGRVIRYRIGTDSPKWKWPKIYYPELTPAEENWNTKLKCPILFTHYENLQGEKDFYHYPMLSYFGIPKVIEAKDIYLMLTAWLAPKDNIKNTMTNEEKIKAAGFDLKTSFRNVK